MNAASSYLVIGYNEKVARVTCCKKGWQGAEKPDYATEVSYIFE